MLKTPGVVTLQMIKYPHIYLSSCVILVTKNIQVIEMIRGIEI